MRRTSCVRGAYPFMATRCTLGRWLHFAQTRQVNSKLRMRKETHMLCGKRRICQMRPTSCVRGACPFMSMRCTLGRRLLFAQTWSVNSTLLMRKETYVLCEKRRIFQMRPTSCVIGACSFMSTRCTLMMSKETHILCEERFICQTAQRWTNHTLAVHERVNSRICLVVFPSLLQITGLKCFSLLWPRCEFKYKNE